MLPSTSFENKGHTALLKSRIKRNQSQQRTHGVRTLNLPTSRLRVWKASAEEIEHMPCVTHRIYEQGALHDLQISRDNMSQESCRSTQVGQSIPSGCVTLRTNLRSKCVSWTLRRLDRSSIYKATASGVDSRSGRSARILSKLERSMGGQATVFNVTPLFSLMSTWEQYRPRVSIVTNRRWECGVATRQAGTVKVFLGGPGLVQHKFCNDLSSWVALREGRMEDRSAKREREASMAGRDRERETVKVERDVRSCTSYFFLQTTGPGVSAARARDPTGRRDQWTQCFQHAARQFCWGRCEAKLRLTKFELRRQFWRFIAKASLSKPSSGSHQIVGIATRVLKELHAWAGAADNCKVRARHLRAAGTSAWVVVYAVALLPHNSIPRTIRQHERGGSRSRYRDRRCHNSAARWHCGSQASLMSPLHAVITARPASTLFTIAAATLPVVRPLWPQPWHKSQRWMRSEWAPQPLHMTPYVIVLHPPVWNALQLTKPNDKDNNEIKYLQEALDRQKSH